MGRPRGRPVGRGRGINKETFEGLCHIFCPRDEICAVLKTSHDTLNEWCKQEYGMTFEDTYKQFDGVRKASLRRIQYEQAKKNVTMAIFLGKQYLGQSDKVETQVEEQPVHFVFNVESNKMTEEELEAKYGSDNNQGK